MADKGINVQTTQEMSDNGTGKVIPIKVNLFAGSDYKQKLRLIYGDKIVDIAEERVGVIASAKELVEKVLFINTMINVRQRPDLESLKIKSPEFVEGSSRDGIDSAIPESIRVFREARPIGLVDGLLSRDRRAQLFVPKPLKSEPILNLDESRVSTPDSIISVADSAAVTAVTGLITPESRVSTPDSIITVVNSMPLN